MTNLEKLKAFFQAENERDWQAYLTFLDEAVVWELQGDQLEVIRGKDAYLQRIQAAYQDSFVHFTCHYYQTNADQSQIVTLLCNSLGHYSCDIFEFRQGLIVKETEYLLKAAD